MGKLRGRGKEEERKLLSDFALDFELRNNLGWGTQEGFNVVQILILTAT